MVVEDDDNIVEVGTAQGFTLIMELKKKKTDPPSITPHISEAMGWEGEHHEVGLQGEVAEDACPFLP